jgi:hypothetical protein
MRQLDEAGRRIGLAVGGGLLVQPGGVTQRKELR